MPANGRASRRNEKVMNKDKQVFRTAVELLREAELAPEQVEALATIERYPGELRRQNAELKAEVDRLQKLVAAERNISDRQQAEQIKSQLEEKLRIAESHTRILEGRVRNLEAQLPQSIPLTDDLWKAMISLAKQCQRIFDKAFIGWEIKKAESVLLQYAVMLTLRTCQMLADQDKTDGQLEKDLMTACKNHFDRLAPGRFSWKPHRKAR